MTLFSELQKGGREICNSKNISWEKAIRLIYLISKVSNTAKGSGNINLNTMQLHHLIKLLPQYSENISDVIPFTLSYSKKFTVLALTIFLVNHSYIEYNQDKDCKRDSRWTWCSCWRLLLSHYLTGWPLFTLPRQSGTLPRKAEAHFLEEIKKKKKKKKLFAWIQVRGMVVAQQQLPLNKKKVLCFLSIERSGPDGCSPDNEIWLCWLDLSLWVQ